MITIKQAEADVRTAFQAHGSTIESLTIEPFMGGYLADVSCDGVPTGSASGTGSFEMETPRTQFREGRQWRAVLGRITRGSTVIRIQGEVGSYGEEFDGPDQCQVKVWIGDVAVPDDVEYGFRLEHETDVARAAVITLQGAAVALAGLSDEALTRADGTWATPDIRTQIRRLEGSSQR